MLRQVTLTLGAKTSVQAVAASHGAKINVVDCKDLNKRDMAFLLDVYVPGGKALDVIADLEAKSVFKRIHAGETEGEPSRSLCIGILNRPAICQTVGDCGAFCLTCPFSSPEADGKWSLLVKDSEQLKRVLAELGAYNIKASVGGLSDASREQELTLRQAEILQNAISLGYFEFPRRLSLTKLSERLGIKPSTLSQILRAAEGKVIARYAAEMKITKAAQVQSEPFA